VCSTESFNFIRTINVELTTNVDVFWSSLATLLDTSMKALLNATDDVKEDILMRAFTEVCLFVCLLLNDISTI